MVRDTALGNDHDRAFGVTVEVFELGGATTTSEAVVRTALKHVFKVPSGQVSSLDAGTQSKFSLDEKGSESLHVIYSFLTPYKS